MAKWFDVFQVEPGSDCTRVSLYDGIGEGGQTADEFINAFNAIKTPRIDLHVNSNGGGILDGFACYNAIKGHPADVTTYIDGVAASIASLIAIAGDKVCMAKNAFMMIHSGWANVAGDPAELRKQADVLDKMTNSIAEAYADKSGKALEDVRKAMDATTWFNAAEAQEWGLVDEIDEDADEKTLGASAMLAVAKYQKVPPKLRKFAAKAAKNAEPKQTRKETHMDKLVCRDGKWFLGEVEVDATAALASVKPPDPKPGEGIEAAVAKAREEGIKTEREYRAMFNTVLATAKLDATASVEFEKEFYGRAETDLKFLASHAIGQRAKPLGEGNPGNGEGESDKAKKADEKLAADATLRFNSEPKIRRMFGLIGAIPDSDPVYQNALKRYVAAAQKQAKDEAAQATGVANAK